MEETCIVGAPAFSHILDEEKKIFRSPIGQVKICQDVLRETQDKEVIKDNLAIEYFAIILGLKKIGIKFYIGRFSDASIPAQVWQGLKKAFKCDFVFFPKNFPREFGCYPRDMITVLAKQKVVLLNSAVGREGIGNKNGYCFLTSSYGEGGRILACEETVLIPKRLIIEGDRVECGIEIDALRKKVMHVGLMPLPLGGTFSLTKIEENLFSNDHLDRVMSLIKGQDEKMHLLLDPKICVVDGDTKNNWIPRGPEESIRIITDLCEPLGIEVHCPHKTEVPYSVNLMQFSDRKILMTSGDDPLAKIVERIVGPENVITTEVPIKFTPVYNQAGIRCLINQIPESMIASLVA